MRHIFQLANRVNWEASGSECTLNILAIVSLSVSLILSLYFSSSRADFMLRQYDSRLLFTLVFQHKFNVAQGTSEVTLGRAPATSEVTDKRP